MEGAATPDFLWLVLMQGHQRKAVMDTYSAIRTAAQLGEQMRSVFFVFFFSSHNLWVAQGSYRKHPCSPVSQARIHSLRCPQRFRVAISVSRQDGLFLTAPPALAMHLSCHTDLANMNVYVYIYGFRYKNGWGWDKVYLSTLPSPDAFSICKYISRQPCQGFMWRWQCQNKLSWLFQSAPYQSCVENNETDNAEILKRLHITIPRHMHIKKLHLNTCWGRKYYISNAQLLTELSHINNWPLDKQPLFYAQAKKAYLK